MASHTMSNIMELKFEGGTKAIVVTHTATWRNPSGTVTSQNTFQSTLPTTHKVVYGENVPNFLLRKKRGEILGATPYSFFDSQSVLLSRTMPARITDSYTGHVMTTEGEPHFLSWFQLQPNISYGECESALYSSKLLEQMPELVEKAVAKCTAGYDVGTSIMEFKDVIRAFANVGASLKALCATIFAKDEWRDLYMKPLHASNCWLELRYGWRTLLADVRELSAALAGLQKPKFPRQRNRAGAASAVTTTRTATSTNDFGVHTLTVNDQFNVNVRGNALYECDNSGFFINPVITAWQLTRLSFVVDWFANITRWLQAWSTELLYEGTTWGSAQIVAKRRWSMTTTAPSARYGNPVFTEMWDSTAEVRLRFDSSLNLTPSGLRCDLSSFQIIDLVALFLQSIYKRITRLG